MKPLRKSDRRRFDDLCRKIREALHLEHWRLEDYDFRHANGSTIAEAGIWEKNSRIGITIYDDFWKKDYPSQLRILIHEHVHCVTARYIQVVRKVTECCSPASKAAYGEWFDHADEHVTDHLESVLYDLLKDRL